MKVLPKAFHEPHLPPFSLSKLNASGFLVNILTLHGADGHELPYEGFIEADITAPG